MGSGNIVTITWSTAGGRYDGLLKKLWPAAAVAVGPPLGGVGATLNAERLASVLAHAQARGRALEESNQVRISQVRTIM